MRMRSFFGTENGSSRVCGNFLEEIFGPLRVWEGFPGPGNGVHRRMGLLAELEYQCFMQNFEI